MEIDIPVWHAGRILENDLTAFVFRVLSFIPKGSRAFFTKLEQYNYDREFPILKNTQDLKYSPWPSDITSIIPDVVIRKTDEWTLVIEAEIGINKKYEPDQLKKQYETYDDNYNGKNSVYHLLINQQWSRPGPELESETGITDYHKKILWFNWQGFAAIFEELLLEQKERSTGWFLLNECIYLLQKKRIVYFKPIEFGGALSKSRLKGLIDEITIKINIETHLFSAKVPLKRLNNALKLCLFNDLKVLPENKKRLVALSTFLTDLEVQRNG